MHDTSIKMKNGREFCAPLWDFRPLEGYLTICADVGGDGKLYLRDIESAITPGQRVRMRNGQMIVEDQDELARAKENGWDGK